MIWNIKQNQSEANMEVHQYYMDIINCMPNIVYWVDADCVLQGCNLNFVKLLGLTRAGDFIGTPYDQMIKHLSWEKTRIESFKLDDMAVLFSGDPEYNVDELPVYSKEGGVIHYQTSRIPLFDADKKVIGLVVILNDMTSQKEMETLLNHTHPTGRAGALNYSGKTVRVLLVEDNIIAQHVQQALLMTLNCDVDIAGSGDAASMLFEPGKYALVFMDIGLQDTSGYIVSKTLREMEKNTRYHVPIIALTAYQADVIKDDCNDYFMDGVITKPLTSEQALQILKRHVYHEEIEERRPKEQNSMDLAV